MTRIVRYSKTSCVAATSRDFSFLHCSSYFSIPSYSLKTLNLTNMTHQGIQLSLDGIELRGFSAPPHQSVFDDEGFSESSGSDDDCTVVESSGEDDCTVVESMTPPRSPSVDRQSPRAGAGYYQSHASHHERPAVDYIWEGTSIVLTVSPEEADTVEPAILIAARKLHLALYTYIFRFIVDYRKTFEDLWQLEPFRFTVNLPPGGLLSLPSCVREKTCHVVQAVQEYVRELADVRPNSGRVSDALLQLILSIGMDRTLAAGFPAGAWNYFMRSRRNEQCQYVLTENDLADLWSRFVRGSLTGLPRRSNDDHSVAGVERACVREKSRLYTRPEGDWPQDHRMPLSKKRRSPDAFVEEEELRYLRGKDGGHHVGRTRG